jgi:hypothetical protein
MSDAYQLACLARASTETVHRIVNAPPGLGRKPAALDSRALEQLPGIIHGTLIGLAGTLSAPAMRAACPGEKARLARAAGQVTDGASLLGDLTQPGAGKKARSGAAQVASLAGESTEALVGLVTATAPGSGHPAVPHKLAAESLVGVIADTLSYIGWTLSAPAMLQAHPEAARQLTRAAGRVGAAARSARNPVLGSRDFPAHLFAAGRAASASARRSPASRTVTAAEAPRGRGR